MVMLHPSRRRTCAQAPGHHRVGGFAMIEALIAILIFSIAVLGLVGLQVSMSRSQTGAKFRADAAYLANDLIGTMWADGANRAAYLSANCSTYAPCQSWETRLHAALPSSTHDITPSVDEVTIKITWQVPNEGSHQYVTTTSITLK
ncbi:MAG: prepilin-type N-terminal cleavage/methylation domain-containing protein [Leptothrix sp. (in: b-proteobacteria)]